MYKCPICDLDLKHDKVEAMFRCDTCSTLYDKEYIKEYWHIPTLEERIIQLEERIIQLEERI